MGRAIDELFERVWVYTYIGGLRIFYEQLVSSNTPSMREMTNHEFGIVFRGWDSNAACIEASFLELCLKASVYVCGRQLDGQCCRQEGELIALASYLASTSTSSNRVNGNNAVHWLPFPVNIVRTPTGLSPTQSEKRSSSPFYRHLLMTGEL